MATFRTLAMALGMLIAVLVGQNVIGTFISSSQTMSLGHEDPANKPTQADYDRLDRIIGELAVAAGKGDSWRPRMVIKPSILPQAYATNSEVGVTIGLMRMCNDAELAFVMGHEMTHMLEDHMVKSIFPRLLVLLLSFMLVVTGIVAIPLAFWRENHGKMALYLWLVIGVLALSSFADSQISQANERAADRGAILLTGNATAGADALQKLKDMKRPKDMPYTPMLGQVIWNRAFPSHPPLSARIDALRAEANSIRSVR
ncbi:MAG: M48 family metalloprotease [Proteobacteria bacterium]|nr:M48 family metalloprotease [Pseudomonadota bacterium]